MQFHSEGGLELLSRFSEKPRTLNLDEVIFSDISNKSIIEIVGITSTGKTMLLCQFLTKCILPAQHKGIKIDGCDSYAILIDTLGHIRINKIAELMTFTIRNAYRIAGLESSVETVDSIVNKSLEKLTVINCCNNDQFQLSLHTLEDELFSNDRIALLAIDNLLTYYWQERREKGILSMDSYTKNLVKLIREHTSQFKTVTVYTRWDELIFKNEPHTSHIKNTLEKTGVNYRLQLCKSNRACEFVCRVESVQDIKQIHYTISDSGIKWIL